MGRRRRPCGLGLEGGIAVTQKVNLLMLPGAEELVREICAGEGVEPDLVIRLVAIEQNFTGMVRRRGIQEAIGAVLASGQDDHA